MAAEVVRLEDLPADERAYIEGVFKLPRIGAATGTWMLELFGVNGTLERIFRRESVGSAELAASGLSWPTWPIPPESP